MSLTQLKLAIVGIGGRPKAFLEAFEKTGRARLAAVCDTGETAMAEAMAGLPEVERYTDYGRMLEKVRPDAVVIGTPMPLHVPQTLQALEQNISVFSEVTAAVSEEECRALAAACRASRGQYMLGENCCYMRPLMTVQAMVRDGLFGELLYAEGEYNHDCRSLIPRTPWRRTWLYDIDGVTYGTHSLGPILSWLEDDRVTEVSCASGGAGACDLEGHPLLRNAGRVLLCRTRKGRLLKIKQNLSSPRPYGLNYMFEGSLGAYQSYGGPEDHREEVWFDGKSKADVWDRLETYQDRYTPELWRTYAEENERPGHLGADVITMIDFINALYEGRAMPIGIDAALDMTLPGLVGQRSVREGGRWLPVPDSRTW